MHSFDNNVYREAFFFKVRLWFSIETPIRKGKSNISIRNFRNKKEPELKLTACYKCVWDPYWELASQLLANLFPCPKLVTVPEVFAKVNSTQFPSRFKVANGK